MSASEFFGHRAHFYFFAGRLVYLLYTIYQKTRVTGSYPKRYFFMVEHCGNFKNGNFENSR